MTIEGTMSHLDRDTSVYESVLQVCDGQLEEVPPRPPKRPLIPPERTRNAFGKQTLRSTHPHYRRARNTLSDQIGQSRRHQNNATTASDETVLSTSSLIPIFPCRAVEPPPRSGVSNVPATVSESIEEAPIHQNDRTITTNPSTNSSATERLPEIPGDSLAASSSQERRDVDLHALLEVTGTSHIVPSSPATDVQNGVIDQPTGNTTEGLFTWLGKSNQDQPAFGAQQPREATALSAGAPVHLHGTILIISCPACGMHTPINLSEVATGPTQEASGNNNPYLTRGSEAADYHQRTSILPSQFHSVNIEPRISYNHHSGQTYVTSTLSIGGSSSSPQLSRLPSLDSGYFEHDNSAMSPSASSTLSGDTSALPYGSVSYDDGFSLSGYTCYDV